MNPRFTHHVVVVAGLLASVLSAEAGAYCYLVKTLPNGEESYTATDCPGPLADGSMYKVYGGLIVGLGPMWANWKAGRSAGSTSSTGGRTGGRSSGSGSGSSGSSGNSGSQGSDGGPANNPNTPKPNRPIAQTPH